MALENIESKNDRRDGSDTVKNMKQLVVNVISQLVFLAVLGIGGWVYNSATDGKLINALGGVSEKSLEGVVLAFDRKDSKKCPDGWQLYLDDRQNDVSGKYIMAAGGEVKNGDTGGVSSINLEISHLPNHSHRIATQLEKGKPVGKKRDKEVRAERGREKLGDYKGHDRRTEATGNGAPIEIKPPFVAFYLCRENSQ